MKAWIVSWTCLALVLGACGDDAGGSAPQADRQSVSPSNDEVEPEEPEEEAEEEVEVADGSFVVEGVDRVFKAPEQAIAGPTKITYRNAGNVNHEVVVGRLAKGDSAGTVARLKKPELLKVIRKVGATGRVPSQQEAIIKVDLKPGNYGLFCLIDVGDGTTHAYYGMYRSLRVING